MATIRPTPVQAGAFAKPEPGGNIISEDSIQIVAANHRHPARRRRRWTGRPTNRVRASLITALVATLIASLPAIAGGGRGVCRLSCGSASDAPKRDTTCAADGCAANRCPEKSCAGGPGRTGKQRGCSAGQPEQSKQAPSRRAPTVRDVQANQFTSSRQGAVSVASAARSNGSAAGFVAVWHSRRQEAGSYGIFARRFSPDGRPIGDEVHVNAHTANMQMYPAVTADDHGYYWFVWRSFGQDGDQGSIVARRFDQSLSPAGDEIVVNPVGTGHQSEPAIAATEGSAVVVWTEPAGKQGARRVVARKLAAGARPAGGAIVISDGSTWARTPCIVAGRDGASLIGWVEDDGSGSGRPEAIVLRRLNEDSTLGDPVRVAVAGDAGWPMEPTIARLGDGLFAALWLRQSAGGVSIVGGRVDGRGRLLGKPHILRTAAKSSVISGFDAAADRRGRLTLVWADADTTTSRSLIKVQHFDQQLTSTGGKIAVAARPDARQVLRTGGGAKRIAHIGADLLVVGWSGECGGGDTSAACVSRLDLPKIPRCAAPDRTGPDQAAPNQTDPDRAAQPGAGAIGDRDGHGECNSAERWLAVERQKPQDDRLERIGGPLSGLGESERGHPLGPAPHEPPVYHPPGVQETTAEASAATAGGGVDFGFVGIPDTGWAPPDPHMAVGPNDLVVIANGRLRFFTKNGVLTFQDELENSFGFWGDLGATNFVFDPEVVYDPHAQRFVVIANERDTTSPPTVSYLLLAVSDDADPNGTWYKYRINATDIIGDSNVIDSPNVGIDGSTIYVTADMFNLGHLVLMMDKAPLLIGDPPVFNSMVLGGTFSLLGRFGLPTIHGSAPAMYLLEADLPTGLNEASSIAIHAITDPLGQPVVQSIQVPIEPYRAPGNIPQLGSSATISTFDARFWSCVYRDGRLWATHHVRRSAATGDHRTLQRWYEIDLNGWPASPGMTPFVAQWGDIDAGGSTNTFFGSIGVDPAGNAAMVFSQSSAAEFPSIGRTGRLVNDPPGTTRPIVTVQTSTSAAPDSPARWGDYSAVVVDPADDTTFWYTHEYRTSGWRTWVGAFSLADTTPPSIASADPFDGYIDPRAESDDGVTVNQGIDRVSITFSEHVVSATAAPLDATAFAVTVSGGANPLIRGVNVSANPTIEVLFRTPIPLQQRTTLLANVADLSGNSTILSVQYGFLPGDITQDGSVLPDDLIRFRQFLAGTATPDAGTFEQFLDVDRDGVVLPLDLIRFRQLLAGSGIATKPWLGETLP